MRVESSLKNMSPQGRLSVYHNRTVGALWLMVLVGMLTIAEPFLLFGSKVIFIPGLIAPEVIVTLIKQSQGSAFHTVLSVVLGLLVIVLGIMGMKGIMGAFTAGAVLLVLDLILLAAGVSLSKPDSQEVFMIAVTLAVRFYLLRIIIRGIRAVGLRRQQKEVMESADREYEEQRKRGIRYALEDDRSDDFESDEYEKRAVPVKKSKSRRAAKSSTGTSEPQCHKYCMNCGSPLIEGSRFCEQCGSEVRYEI